MAQTVYNPGVKPRLLTILALISFFYLANYAIRAVKDGGGPYSQSFYYRFLVPPVRDTMANRLALRSSRREIHGLLGFHWGRTTLIAEPGVGPAKFFAVPQWFVVVACAIFPTLWCTRKVEVYRRRSRQDGGFCAKCGYDLRATPNLCPECGTAAAQVE
jgi:hypothetical protein